MQNPSAGTGINRRDLEPHVVLRRGRTAAPLAPKLPAGSRTTTHEINEMGGLIMRRNDVQC